MVLECREYLIDLLKKSGVRTNIITNWKRLQLNQEAHLGAVCFQSDEFSRDGSKKYFEEDGKRKIRTKKFQRETVFSIVIGEYTMEKCEAIFESFMKYIDKGIYLDGNYVEIETFEMDWVDKEETTLKSSMAANFKVKFIGGMYEDKVLSDIPEIEINV